MVIRHFLSHFLARDGKDCSIGVESTTQCPLLHSLMYIDIADHTIVTLAQVVMKTFSVPPSLQELHVTILNP